MPYSEKYAILYVYTFMNLQLFRKNEVNILLKTNESAENYLETILVLSQKKPVVRGVDIAEELGFKKSSVSVAMKNLREKEQIRVTPEATST